MTTLPIKEDFVLVGKVDAHEAQKLVSLTDTKVFSLKDQSNDIHKKIKLKNYEQIARGFLVASVIWLRYTKFMKLIFARSATV